jgi:hypothetical protein
MHLGASSLYDWLSVGVITWEGLVSEETLTCRFLSYHPRVMGLTLTSSSNENICSANWFDRYSLPDAFWCSLCLVNKSLLLTISIKILASLGNLLLKVL